MIFSKGSLAYFEDVPSDIKEGYTYDKDVIISNIGADHLEIVLNKFIDFLPNLATFFISLPINKQLQKQLYLKDVTNLDKAVYYAPNLTKDDLKEIVHSFGDLLINDGIRTFGFSGQMSKTQICCEPFNVVKIYTSNKIEQVKIALMLEEIGIKKLDYLKTAFEKIDVNSKKLYNLNGDDIYQMVNKMQKWHLYLSEIRSF